MYIHEYTYSFINVSINIHKHTGENSTWPEDTWGMSLGRVVVRIKYEYAHADKTEELTLLGIIQYIYIHMITSTDQYEFMFINKYVYMY
jgi:hypothetical protein